MSGEIVTALCICCGIICWTIYGIFACKYDRDIRVVLYNEDEREEEEERGDGE